MQIDKYVEEGFCLACGKFTTHYYRHCSIHQQVNVNKVIMDHCKRYPRESLYGLKSMENEDQLKIPNSNIMVQVNLILGILMTNQVSNVWSFQFPIMKRVKL
ncbi:hypothetical protein ACTFIY_011700 [Dictyostelium cf. discoideum]